MGRFARHGQASRQRGFTLLEILLVMFVLGLAAGSISLVLDTDPERKAAIKAGDEFATVISMALEESALSGEQFGLVIEPDRYFFTRWDVDKDKWTALKNGDPMYRQRKWPAGISTDVSVEGMPLLQEEDEASEFGLDRSLFEPSDEEKMENPEPQLLLLPSGEMTAFTLHLEVEISGEPDLELALVGNALGRIQWQHDLEAEE